MKDQTLFNPFALDDIETPASRRTALRKMGKVGAGMALAALPSVLLPKMAFAQENTAVDILNYALTLEYLEESYYRQGTESGVITDADALEVFELIEQHEASHVAFLAAAVETAGGTPVELNDDAFDFTAGGTFSPFEDYPTFLTLAMAFEDTGVRAYKGQAANIIGTAYLKPALQIHSLEARHAAEVRRLRDAMGIDVDPWIVLDSGTDGTPLEPVYGAGMPADMFPPEENITQAGADLTTLGYTAEQVSAAFDEPLDMSTVNTIAGLFLADQG